MATQPAGVDVDALVSEMTLEEKAAQLGSASTLRLVDGDGRLDLEAARHSLGRGIGHITRVASETGLPATDVANLSNSLQRVLREETRLGIPAIIHDEALSGVCGRGATQFPQAIGLASTWDPELVGEMAEAIRAQLRALGVRQALAPVLDIARDPRWGRLEETYGESSYLVARMGVAYVRGLQGLDLRHGVAATAKHFLAYGLPEGGMNHASAVIGPRLLREVVAAPFRAVIAEAELASLMPAYNDVDGQPCHGSAELLETLLRQELGFAGVTVADYWGIHLLASWHGVAADDGAAAAMAFTAGLDLELPAFAAYRRLPGLVKDGTIPEGLVDRSCRRVLELKARLGLFEDPYVVVDPGYELDGPDARALARRAARESIVLCTNPHAVLPLGPRTRVALIGPAADDARLYLGDYAYPAHVEIIHESQPVDGAPISGPGSRRPPLVSVEMPTLREELTARGFDVRHCRGCDVADLTAGDLDEAVATAADADVAVLLVGGRSGLTRASTSGEFRDVTSLDLPGRQYELAVRVMGTGTPTVLVFVGGRVHAVPDLVERAAAVLWAWLPGEEGGPALADVLSGAVDPSGRLPVTVPRSVGQVPIHHDHLSGAGRSQMLGDYVDSPVSPLFSFGHGLSYSEFDYSDLVARVDEGHETVTVTCTVRNAGDRRGTEVVQLYVRDDIAAVSRPVRSLAGFTRVELDAGGAAEVTFDIDLARLGYFGADLRYCLEPGTFQVMVGSSAADTRLRASVHVGGGMRWPDPNALRPTATTARPR